MQLALMIALCGLVSLTVAAPLVSEQGQKDRANIPLAFAILHNICITKISMTFL